MTPKQIQIENDKLAVYVSRLLNGCWLPLCITRVCVTRDNITVSKDPIGQFIIEVVITIDENQRVLFSSKDAELSIAVIKLHNEIYTNCDRLTRLATTIKQLPMYILRP